MRFLRYGEKRHNDSLLAMGGIRIGTLHDFRNSEHKRGVADPTEGKKVVTHTVDYAVLGSGSIHDRAVEAYNFIKGHGAGQVTLQNVVMGMNFDSPDCFVLCGSYEHSRNVAAEFDKADSCIEVIGFTGFVQCITDVLASMYALTSVHAEQVVYSARGQQWNGIDWGNHPSFIKEPEFINQKEVRIVWAVRPTVPIKPVVISDSRLIGFCRDVGIP